MAKKYPFANIEHVGSAVGDLVFEYENAVPFQQQIESTFSDNYCGETLVDAIQRCDVKCDQGLDSECPGGEKCFIDIPEQDCIDEGEYKFLFI